MSAKTKIANYMASDRSGYLYLQGCTGLTALPEGLTVGGYLDLQGCTGLTHYAILNHRGYTAYFINGRIYAGCRNFSIDQARSHWASDPVVIAALETKRSHKAKAVRDERRH